jgi:dipeptide transport system ATP-binding protein
MPLLEIRNLHIEFGPAQHAFKAVDGLDLRIEAGETLGIVGESGSGKSVSMMALMGLLDSSARVQAQRITFAGVDLLQASPSQKRSLMGHQIAMIFQDPMTSLNPCFTVGYQITEVLRSHLGLRGAAAKAKALALLEQVEIPDAARRLNHYPHQFSGGMSQRVMIAMAIACGPQLLIADEPTTALDVTIQAQIMDLLRNLQKNHGMALLIISHDLAVVSQMAQRVAVMYAGQIVEHGPLQALFSAPAHPYTQALLACTPERNRSNPRLASLPGMVPGPRDRPSGCLLAPRCPRMQARCNEQMPHLSAWGEREVRCFYPLTIQTQEPL